MATKKKSKKKLVAKKAKAKVIRRTKAVKKVAKKTPRKAVKLARAKAKAEKEPVVMLEAEPSVTVLEIVETEVYAPEPEIIEEEDLAG